MDNTEWDAFLRHSVDVDQRPQTSDDTSAAT